MHGRLKVKDSVEKAAEKAREKEKKRKKYVAGINVLFRKRTEAIHDGENLHISALLLQANPDALTLWNIRRETVLALRDGYKRASVDGESVTSLNCTASASNASDHCNSLVETSVSAASADENFSAVTTSTTPSHAASASTTTSLAASGTSTSPLPAMSDTATTPSPASSLNTNGKLNTASIKDRIPDGELLTVSRPAMPTTWPELLRFELSVITSCLQHNPKSYGAWHHRVWVMTQLCQDAAEDVRKAAWDEELKLCDLFLSKDERNFHCWDYRRIVCREGSVPVSRELRYTLHLVERNLSNFSAWHQRARLLPLLYPPEEGGVHPVKDAVFTEELQRVVQAVFTDPSDQSPWFFLRWLLQRPAQAPRPVVCGMTPVSPQGALLVCGYTVAVPRTALPRVTLAPHLECWDDMGSSAWQSSSKYERDSVWSILLPVGADTLADATLTLHFPSGESASFGHADGPSVRWLGGGPACTQLPSASIAMLQELRENCKMLDSVDPGNKWVLLTLVSVVWSLGEREQAMQTLEALRDGDPLRADYYTDMMSQLTLESLIEGFSASTPPLEFDAAQLCLTRVDTSTASLLSCCWHVSLAGNSVRCLAPLRRLLSCRQLVLDGNPVSSLTPLAGLPVLRSISLSGCGLSDPSQVEPLLALSSIDTLNLKDNLFKAIDKEKIQEMFKHVQCLEL